MLLTLVINVKQGFAQTNEIPEIIINVVDKNDHPIPYANISARSRNFIDLKGKTGANGIYTTSGHPLEKELIVGERIEIKCVHPDYRSNSISFTIGKTLERNNQTIVLQKKEVGQVNLRGRVLNEKDGQALSQVLVTVNLKKEKQRSVRTTTAGFNLAIPRDQIINPNQIVVTFSREGFQPVEQTLGIPATGDIPSQTISMRPTPIKVAPRQEEDKRPIRKSSKLGYIPYLGHFIPDRTDRAAGFVFTGLGLASTGMMIYGGLKEIEFENEALKTINQASRSRLMSEAERHGVIRQISLWSLVTTTVISLAANIIKENQWQSLAFRIATPLASEGPWGYGLGVKVVVTF